MRIVIAATFAAVALTGCATAPMADQGPSPSVYDIARNYSEGMVIVAVDDPPPSASPQKASFFFGINWFDPVRKKPYYSPKILASSIGSRTITDENGHRFVIVNIAQGESVITQYVTQTFWGMCYNAATYHFFVKGGSYNFIGRFNDQPSFQALDDAIAAGKLPSRATDRVSMLNDQSLNGFTTSDRLPPAETQHVTETLTRLLGHPVDLQTPVMTRTDFNLTDGKCLVSSPPEEKPDRSKPAAPETSPGAPTADSAAKPASATTWIPRP